MKKIILSLILNITLIPILNCRSTLAQQETTTILTYYPAPFGYYKTLFIGQNQHFLTIDYTTQFNLSNNGTDNLVLSRYLITSNFPDIFITSNGNIGLGTNAPTHNLTIAGPALLRGSAGTLGFFLNSQGYLGINNLSPDTYLSVNGDMNITQNLTVASHATFKNGLRVNGPNSNVRMLWAESLAGIGVPWTENDARLIIAGAVTLGPAGMETPALGTIEYDWGGSGKDFRAYTAINTWESLTATGDSTEGVKSLKDPSGISLNGNITLSAGNNVIFNIVESNSPTLSRISIATTSGGSIAPYGTPTPNYIPKFYDSIHIGNSNTIYEKESQIGGKTVKQIGIGTNDPNAKLQVIGAISRQGTYLYGNNAHTNINLGIDSVAGRPDAVSGYCTVSGGQNNSAINFSSTVGGGYNNIAWGSNATVLGGNYNTAENTLSAIGGGGHNTVKGYSAAIPGGQQNEAGGNYSFAAGRRAKANNNGCFVWADSADEDFSSSADNQFCVRATGGIFLKGIAGGATHYIRHNRDNGQLLYLVSSLRYKNNILPFTDNFYRILMLSPKSFSFKGRGQKGFGYIAEDLDSLGLKNLVYYTKDGSPESILYELFPIYLIEILKRHEVKINKISSNPLIYTQKVIGPSDLHVGDVVEYTGEIEQAKNGSNTYLGKVAKCATAKSRLACIIVSKKSSFNEKEAVYEILEYGTAKCGKLKGTGRKGDFLVSTSDGRLEADNNAHSGAVIGQLITDVKKETQDLIPIMGLKC